VLVVGCLERKKIIKNKSLSLRDFFDGSGGERGKNVTCVIETPAAVDRKKKILRVKNVKKNVAFIRNHSETPVIRFSRGQQKKNV